MAYSGKKALIKVSGAPVPFEGEATTNVGGDDKTYRILDSTKKILDKSVAPTVYVEDDVGTAITGTTATTIKITAHGLTTGDAILNITFNEFRTVTVVDANTLTVTAITGQTSGDLIAKFHRVTSGYTVDTLNGIVIFDTVDATRTVKISGAYLTMAIAAECKEYSLSINGETIDTSQFQDTWNRKIQGLKSAEGSLSRWLDIDTYFTDTLISGNPVVIEMYAQDTVEPDKIWAVINSNEMSAAVDGANEEAVSFESTDKLIASYVVA